VERVQLEDGEGERQGKQVSAEREEQIRQVGSDAWTNRISPSNGHVVSEFCQGPEEEEVEEESLEAMTPIVARAIQDFGVKRREDEAQQKAGDEPPLAYTSS
jgi:hypothetical protein